MNVPKLIAACLAMTLSLAAGCSKDEDTNYYAGYSSPGKFAPKGVAWEKAYNFSNISESCQSTLTTKASQPDEIERMKNTGNCGAVHVSWYSSTTLSDGYPIEGIAANDRHQTPSNFTIKITRNINLSWKVTVAMGGVKYSNNTDSTNTIELVKLTSSVRTIPFDYDPTPAEPDSGDEIEASGTFLKLMFVRFTGNITLYTVQGDNTKPTIEIIATGPLANPSQPVVYLNSAADPPEVYNLPTSGDYMIVQDNGL